MEFKDKSTECIHCHKTLTWISHIKRWYEGREVQEFTFRCERCKREYKFSDGKLTEKHKEPDAVAEQKATVNTTRSTPNGHALNATSLRTRRR